MSREAKGLQFNLFVNAQDLVSSPRRKENKMAKFARHYMDNGGRIRCATGSRWGWMHQIRLWTNNLEEVTCKKCLNRVRHTKRKGGENGKGRNRI